MINGRSYTKENGDDVDYGSLLTHMRWHVKQSRSFYIKGLFHDSFKEACEAIVLWDAQDAQNHRHTARDLWGEALLMAYKASVADIKSTMNEAVNALVTQRRLMLKIESSFDAGSDLLVRFRSIHTALVPLRGVRNRRDDRIHNMVPQLSPLITRAQLQRAGSKLKNSAKRVFVR